MAGLSCSIFQMAGLSCSPKYKKQTIQNMDYLQPNLFLIIQIIQNPE